MAWIALSIIIGTIIYFVEMEYVDKFVMGLAMDESKMLISGRLDTIKRGSPSEHELLKEELKKYGHFAIMEIYNAKQKQIIEVKTPNAGDIEEYIDNNLKEKHILSAEINYNRFYFKDKLYLQVFTPLKESTGGIAGYFEGIYEVDDNTMLNIKKRIYGSILLVVTLVFTTTGILYPLIIGLHKSLISRSRDLLRANIGMLKVLGSAIAKRDSDTNSHNYRVTIYSVEIAQAYRLSKGDIRDLIVGSFLHDVGKIGISDNILLKNGKLTDEEFDIMKMHVRHGVDIVKAYRGLGGAINIVKYHHEKYDGSGYLTGLVGEAIPLDARIFTIADVFDALTSKRPYKEPFSFETAMSIMKEGDGRHFDTHVMRTFEGIAKELYERISKMDEKTLDKTLDDIIKKYFEM
ncbi:MAG: HD-GYP domain-containing protein [Candidatus Magnetoovum sp. WYHC-5]|nr:HD-GYP domain-containing protein [Candidatus Magnetoovum sp. WYHC-5]